MTITSTPRITPSLPANRVVAFAATQNRPALNRAGSHLSAGQAKDTLHVAPRFGARLKYPGPVTSVILGTDFGDGLSNLRAEEAFEAALHYTLENKKAISRAFPGIQWADWRRSNPVKATVEAAKRLVGIESEPAGVLPVKRFHDVPSGHLDYVGRALQELAFSPHIDSRHKIFVPVVDPGVGNASDRAILITKNHGIHIGPNNGLWGLLLRSLEAEAAANGNKEKPYELLPIDLKKVRQLEALRMNNDKYYLYKTFHGRDVFAPVAAYIAAGIDPHFFADQARLNDFKPRYTLFSEHIRSLPKEIGQSDIFYAFKDNTSGTPKESNSGNIITNLVVPPLSDENPLPEGWSYQITSLDDPHFERPIVTEVPLREYFDQVGKGEPLVYPGSTYSPEPNSRFLELAINGGNANRLLGLEPGETRAFRIRRVAPNLQPANGTSQDLRVGSLTG